MNSESFDYWYKAIVVGVYDGDTLTLDLDLGFDIWHRNMRVRLLGIDTPELRGVERAEGLRVRDHVRELLPAGTRVVVQSFKDRTGKYGRYLVTLHFETDRGEISLNKYLLENGMAIAYPT